MLARQIAAIASQGLGRWTAGWSAPVLLSALWCFLLLVGFWALAGLGRGLLAASELPLRDTRYGEALRGVVIGWLMAILAVVPLVLAGDLQVTFFTALRYWGLALAAAVGILVATLALELVFRGFLLVQLVELIGPTLAAVVSAVLYTVFFAFRPYASRISIVVAFLFGLLLAMGYLRTRALWLSWGLHAAWSVALALLFGLPLAADATYNTVLASNASGPRWFSGGAYGPEGSLFGLLATLVAFLLLYRASRDYAWTYTHAPIVAAGYEVTLAPPAAHTAMEAAAAPAPLVQIIASTPTAPSTVSAIEDDLRGRSQLS